LIESVLRLAAEKLRVCVCWQELQNGCDMLVDSHWKSYACVTSEST